MAEEMHAELKYLVLRQTMAGWNIPPRLLKEYELVYVTKGVGYIGIEEEVFRVTAGDLIFFPPGVKNSLWVKEEPYFAFYGMHFSISEGESPPSFPYVSHPVSSMRLVSLFRRINEVHIEKGYLYEWRERLLLNEILLEICTFLHEMDEPIANLRVRKALKDIQNYPLSELSAALLMEKTGMRKTSFFHTFKRITGSTPVQYIIGLKLESARDLLENTFLPVSQIAETCGFSDPLYFSRCFRTHYKMSPRAYRECMQKRD